MSKSYAQETQGPWLTGPPAETLPPVRYDFGRARDGQVQSRSAEDGRTTPADPPQSTGLQAERDRALAMSARSGAVAAPHSKAASLRAPDHAWPGTPLGSRRRARLAAIDQNEPP